jgi:hypothetical protein
MDFSSYPTSPATLVGSTGCEHFSSIPELEGWASTRSRQNLISGFPSSHWVDILPSDVVGRRLVCFLALIAGADRRRRKDIWNALALDFSAQNLVVFLSCMLFSRTLFSVIGNGSNMISLITLSSSAPQVL